MGYHMKIRFLISWTVLWIAGGALAQQTNMYKCQAEYTNTLSESEARKRNCKRFAGGNLSVVQAHKSPAASSARAGTAGAQPGQKVDPGEQRTKDSDARLILESELKKAEARQVELLKEFKNGEPDKVGGEARNYQKYLDRVDELKASIARNESDIASIRRELDRIPPASK